MCVFERESVCVGDVQEKSEFFLSKVGLPPFYLGRFLRRCSIVVYDASYVHV